MLYLSLVLRCLDTVFSGHTKHFQSAFQQSSLNYNNMKSTPIFGGASKYNVFLEAIDVSMETINQKLKASKT